MPDIIIADWAMPIFDGLEEGFARYHSRQIDAIKGIGRCCARSTTPPLPTTRPNGPPEQKRSARLAAMPVDAQLAPLLDLTVFGERDGWSALSGRKAGP